MKGIICYFSTTGNTKLACKYINSKVGNVEFEYYDITSANKPDFSNYDLIGFATYTDFFKPGKLMVEYIKSIKGNDKPAFVFNTYGQMSGNTLAIMSKNVKDSGFKLIEGYSLHVPENYPPLIKNGTTNEIFPTTEDLKSFNEFMTSLNSKAKQLDSGDDVSEKQVKTNILISFMGKIMSGINMDKMGDKNVHKDQCTSCGVCAKVCPYDAISMVDKHPSFDESKCHSCYSCYNKCHVKAIYTKKLDGVGHYAKPHVNLINKLK